MNFLELVELVRDGYKEASLPYKQTKDRSILQLPVFQAWCRYVPDLPLSSTTFEDEHNWEFGQQKNHNHRPHAPSNTQSPSSSSSQTKQTNEQEGTSSSVGWDRRLKGIRNVILELGCGCGEPVGAFLCHSLEKTSTAYLGIDLSDTQIELAKQEYPENSECYKVAEMLEFTKSQRENSISGAIALNTIFHLPRTTHVELLVHLQRVLKPGSALLFNVPENADEGYEENWLGASTMYWSNFSVDWYEMTLKELGYELIMKYKDVRQFLEGGYVVSSSSGG